MPNELTEADVGALLDDPSVANRHSTARKIALGFAGGALTPREREIAVDILRAMVHDSEVRIRRELSSLLSDCPELPHDIARALADDIESIALPILSESVVLTDQDMLEIIAMQSFDKQKAIAARAAVSSRIADALVDTGRESVVSTLFANPGADIAEASIQKALDTLGSQTSVTDPLVMRATLPVGVAERLISLVSDHMQERLLARHNISSDLASDVILRVRERATLNLLSDGAQSDVADLVASLHAQGRLTSSIIIRALFTGDVRFVEAALAHLAGISTLNAAILMRDKGTRGLKGLIAHAGLNAALYPALRAGIEACDEIEYDGGENDLERHRSRIIERLLTSVEKPDTELAIGTDNVEYLLRKLSPAI